MFRSQIYFVFAAFSLAGCLNPPQMTELQIKAGQTAQPSPSPKPPSTPAPGGTVRTLQSTATGEMYCPNGCAQTATWQPGDVIEIPPGHWSVIDIGGAVGTADKPIVIRNKVGVVQVDVLRIELSSRYIQLLGNGGSSFPYGIKAGVAGGGVGVVSTASDFEIAYVEMTASDVGLMVKRNPVAGQPETQYPSVQANISIHDNWIHDVHGEGMYIGHTYPNSDPYHNNLTPARLNNVKIHHNTVTGTDWDGIQLSNCMDNAEIDQNEVHDFGKINMGSQQAGIIMGGNCSGSIHHNVVDHGTGNGIQMFGYGTVSVSDNTIIEAGQDGTASGQESIYFSDFINGVESRPKQKAVAARNVIKNSAPSLGRRGTIRASGYNNNSDPASFTDNQLYLRGISSSSDWINQYLIVPTASSVRLGNLLFGY